MGFAKQKYRSRSRSSSDDGVDDIDTMGSCDSAGTGSRDAKTEKSYHTRSKTKTGKHHVVAFDSRHVTCTLFRNCMLLWLMWLTLLPSCCYSFMATTTHRHDVRMQSLCSMTAMDHSEKGEKESQAVRLHDDKNDHLLLNLLSPPERCDVDRMSSTDLAYIGDVVYEMLVRSKKVWPPKRTSDLQQQVVKMVRAEYQASMVACLRQQTAESSKGITSDGNTNMDGKPQFMLNANEDRVMNRGRNAGAKTNHRKSNPAAYQDATALEALLGHLYITDRSRCTQLLQWIEYHLDHID